MKLYRTIMKKLMDPQVSYEERTLIMLAVISDVAMILAVIADIIEGENKIEIITLVALTIGVPIVTGISVHYGKILLGSLLQVMALVFIVLPVIFFFGGGPQGGGVFWIVFSYMFIGMSLPGLLQLVMVLCLTLLTVSEYFIWMFYPELVYPHSKEMFFSDALVSVILVGLLLYGMLWYQKLIYKMENERAWEETKRAEELNRSQSRFFSSMSHEIRTPINSILGLNEIILRQEDASEEIKKDAANIQGSGRMLLALVNDILDISKIEAGKMDIVPVNYSVSSLVSEIVNMIWLRAEQKGLQLKVDIDPSIPSELFGDEVRIKQILVNLLNNAVKYSKEGSITLHIEKEELADDRVYVVFSVTDTGMGIKQDALPHLFDAFQRVDEEKNRHIEGTGLGLSIVKQLVDLMDGTISVNSIYGQGSTFNVALWQSVTNAKPLGDINISNTANTGVASSYESSFSAPEASVLIVDDNEMNLEVESKLLADTKVRIETAVSGMKALEMAESKQYDLILMDYLMPEMDGIECLLRLRKQNDGLNQNTPVVILTANAGGENQELYARSGFDGYLVKPVSGRQLEEMLLKHLPADKVIRTVGGDFAHEEMNTAKGYRRKVPVLITSSSMCDLPAALIRELQLDIIAFFVHTKNGTFWDNVEADGDELVRYMKEHTDRLESEPPKVEEFEKFFASKLRKAHHIIHIAITPSMSEEYARACEAANNFDNVTVVNAQSLSSATGLLVLIAYQMAQQNQPVDRIVEELDRAKKRIHCSFIVARTDFMMKAGYLSERVHRIMATLYLRPSLEVKNDRFGLGRIFMGRRKECYGKYIHYALPRHAKPDTDVIFVTYVDVSEEDLDWIGQEIRKRFAFAHIIFQKASAAISVNCGSGTFGLLYMDKSDQSYHLGSMIQEKISLGDWDEKESEGAVEEQVQEDTASSGQVQLQGNMVPVGKDNAVRSDKSLSQAYAIDQSLAQDEEIVNAEPQWYEQLEGIDAAIALKNSGSETAFLSVLQIFYDSIPSKEVEIEAFYADEDWNSYTIKVHALKSSAKLVGAMKLSEDAQNMENAGKAGDTDYIIQHHTQLMEDYRHYLDVLAPHYAKEKQDTDEQKPIADKGLMESVYEALAEAAKDMDCDTMESVLLEMEDYAVMPGEAKRYAEVKECVDRLDYDGVLALLKEYM